MVKRVLAAVCAALCLFAFNGCEAHHAIKLPQLKALEKELRETIPTIEDMYNVYGYAIGLDIDIACGDVTREEALTIARKVRELFIQEEFQDELFAAMDGQSREDYLENHPPPPTVSVFIHGNSYPRMPQEWPTYFFWADFYADRDMSGKGYIYDGYSTWHGKHKGEEIDMEEILEAE